jgi:hypothetical protein
MMSCGTRFLLSCDFLYRQFYPPVAKVVHIDRFCRIGDAAVKFGLPKLCLGPR